MNKHHSKQPPPTQLLKGNSKPECCLTIGPSASGVDVKSNSSATGYCTPDQEHDYRTNNGTNETSTFTRLVPAQRLS